MYDISKRIVFNDGVTVGDLIETLETLPQKTKVVICEEDSLCIHVERDDSVVCIDNEDRDEEYINDDNTTADEYWANRERNERKNGSINEEEPIGIGAQIVRTMIQNVERGV